MIWQFLYGKHKLLAHAPYFKRVHVSYEPKLSSSFQSAECNNLRCRQIQAQLGYNGYYQAEVAWTEEEVQGVDNFLPH